MPEIETIIVRMPNWIGDLVMATPVLADLRKAYPKAHITAMCRLPIAELLESDPNIDELFCFSKLTGIRRRFGNRNVTEKLKQGKYDLGVLLTHSFSSAWWFWVGHVKRRLGYRGHFRSLLLTDPVSFPEQVKQQHLVLTYKALLTTLGIPLSQSLPAIYLRDEEKLSASRLLARYGITEKTKIVGIHPGAAYGTAKCWLPERFRQVTQKLCETEKDVYCVYFGDLGTVKLIQGICEGMPANVVNLAGTTSIRELSSLISLCTVFLTNDSGPMHIADALGVKTIALFGSTDPKITGPYGGGCVIQKKVPCSPCYKRVCPIDFPCMKGIAAEQVYEQIRQNL